MFLSFSLSQLMIMPCRFIPKYFEKNIDSGIPALTAEGRKAVQDELNEEPFECAGAPAKSTS